jgi:hypothetical protein
MNRNVGVALAHHDGTVLRPRAGSGKEKEGQKESRNA